MWLPDIFDAQKSIASDVHWTDVSHYNLGFEVPLMIDGATVAGLRLRGKASKLSPEADYMLQLEYCPAGVRGGGLDRIDWRPAHQHNNKGKGPKAYQHMMLTTSHHHMFSLNWLEIEERMLVGNLPVAVPLEDDPQSAGDFFSLAEKQLRISGLSVCPAPQWQGSLFGSK